MPPECEGEKSWTGPQRKKGWAVWLVRITDIGLEYHCSAAVVFKRSLVLLTVEVLWRNLGGKKADFWSQSQVPDVVIIVSGV